jgi:hypothetical protein
MMKFPRQPTRNASVTLEFILVLPLLVVILFAVAQFTVALLIRQAVTHAAIVGAREAGKGEGIEEVARAVDGVLDGAHGIDVATVTVPPGHTARIRIGGCRRRLGRADRLGGWPAGRGRTQRVCVFLR